MVFAYEDELVELVKADLHATETKLGKDYGKKKIQTDFSGLSGMIEFLNLLAGVDQKTTEESGSKIALISAVGAITSGKSESDLFGSSTMGSETIIKAINKARDDDSVKAIVLRVDSPGGSAIASDLMWHAIESAQKKKPVIASMGNVAASGGLLHCNGYRRHCRRAQHHYRFNWRGGRQDCHRRAACQSWHYHVGCHAGAGTAEPFRRCRAFPTVNARRCNC